MRKVFPVAAVLIMMLRMQRLAIVAAAALLASCAGSPAPAPSGNSAIASAMAQDPDAQAAELASKGISSDPPKVTFEQQDKRKYEIHEVTINPNKSGGTFILCRYFMAMDQWILEKMTVNKNGTKTYIFRRLVQGPNIEVDPLKPQPIAPKKTK